MKKSDPIPPGPSDAEHSSADGGDDETLFASEDPFALFETWFAAAKAKEARDPNAMALATADADGMPDVRMVLLKGVDTDGFVFYTNTESAKGGQLDANPQAAGCFYWRSIGRQVRFRGPVSRVSDAEADAYFASRARESRIGAWASDQSRELEGRFALEGKVAKYAAKFNIGEIPRPPHWTGFRIAPLRIEFWRERAFRLHDRLEFARARVDARWATRRLYP
jgi:pyridoxamine 5'-phosphate oxidase